MIGFRKRDEQQNDPKPASVAGAAMPNDKATASDDGLSLPIFRPATPVSNANQAVQRPTEKELPMARSPFAPNQPQPVPASPASAAAMPGATFRPTGARSDAAERRTLVVGRGISVQGVVQDAERLVVEGTVEATMINATELSIAQGGVFKGEVEVEEAEIAGTIDGTLTARHALIVRATGRVLGTARCKRLQVEDGGQITGRIEMITDSTTKMPE